MRRKEGALIHWGDLNGGVLLDAQLEQNANGDDRKPRWPRCLWTSPEAATEDWEAWCKEEQYTLHDRRWRLWLRPEVRLFIIAGLDDLERLVRDHGGPSWGARHHPGRYHDERAVDWGAVAAAYDGVYLTAAGQWATRLSIPLDLYGWDCESVVLFRAASSVAQVESC